MGRSSMGTCAGLVDQTKTCNMFKSLPVIGLLYVAALALAAPIPTQNIVELAAGIPDLSTLVKALKAGNLTTALSGPGPFTVFAPTNEGYAEFTARPQQHQGTSIRPRVPCDFWSRCQGLWLSRRRGSRRGSEGRTPGCRDPRGR